MKADWCNVSPEQGSGSHSVSVSSAAAHTGRTARSTVLTISAAGVADKTVSVNQAGKPAFVDSQDTATATKTAANVMISGTSNAKKLTFALGTGGLAIVLPKTYTAASLSTDNGSEISGDPGASSEYAWSIVIAVAENTGMDELSRQIVVTDENGNTDTCTLTQAAGDATLTLSKTSIDLTWQGTAVSFDVTSNTSWTIA